MITGMQNVLAKDAVFTTIIRDPVTMYESLFTYLHMAGIYSLPEGKALEMFLEMPDFYYNISNTPFTLGIALPTKYGKYRVRGGLELNQKGRIDGRAGLLRYRPY